MEIHKIHANSARLIVPIMLFSLGILGCESWYTQKRVVRDSFPGLREMADPESQSLADRLSSGGQHHAGWAILLAEFEGRNHASKASQLITRLMHEAQVSHLWVQTTKESSRVYRGNYSAPNSEAAQYDLARTRNILVEGSQPYKEARLVSLGSGDSYEITSEYDLRRHPGMYSVQIGYYDEKFGRDFRKAAEQAVQSLREIGEDAYFYHGPNMSMVTVGIFSEEDRIQRSQQTNAGSAVVGIEYSERVRDVQRRYPHNLSNGVRQLRSEGEGQAIPESSFMVKVPGEARNAAQRPSDTEFDVPDFESSEF